MTASINPIQIHLDEILEHYQIVRDSIVKTAEQTKSLLTSSTVPPDHPFFGKSVNEVSKFYSDKLEETDCQTSLFIVASAEAALRVDYTQRVDRKKKDSISREFRAIDKANSDKISLDNHILDTLAKQHPTAKASVSQLRGALHYRHWLAHGRYWYLLGQKYDPSGLAKIITTLFHKIGLNTSPPLPRTKSQTLVCIPPEN
ncbi:MAG: hypothetical protein WCI03_14035 [bacterium]